MATTIYVCYEEPDTGEMTEISCPIARADFAPSFEEASIPLHLAAVVAEYAEIPRIATGPRNRVWRTWWGLPA